MNKEEKYRQFITDFAALLSGEHDEVSVLSNASAAIKDRFGFFWVGFYIVRTFQSEPTLCLGPFQGNVACYRISYGKGVCGTAWKQQHTIIVPDVEDFPGHIACSSLSRSEIVIPIISHDKVVAVLDIDSTQLATFDQIDQTYLEKICEIISTTIYNH